jgi:hypothetical protein
VVIPAHFGFHERTSAGFHAYLEFLQTHLGGSKLLGFRDRAHPSSLKIVLIV